MIASRFAAHLLPDVCNGAATYIPTHAVIGSDRRGCARNQLARHARLRVGVCVCVCGCVGVGVCVCVYQMSVYGSQ